jgi:hypothetical protein
MVTRRIWPALLAIAVLLPAAPAQARPKLALQVGSLSRAPSSVRSGARITIAYKVTRAGAGLKRASLRFYLSRTARKKAALALGGPSLGKLVRKRTVKGKAHLTVPAGASGRYRLLACVEKVKTRGKRKLSAPCKAAKGTLTVAVPAGSGAPAPGGGAAPAPGGSPSPTPTPTPAPQTWSDAPTHDPATPLATANPLDVTPALDTAHRAGGTIGAAGGTLTATGADGTAFTLTVPAGALVSDEDIAMTPVSSIGGLPFDSLVGAVDLQPDGLQLLKAARLEITPAGTAPTTGEQSFFAYEGTGRDFHNYPPATGTAALAIDLPHFTGGGLAKGTQAQRDAVAEKTPAEYTAQYEAEAAQAVRDYKNGTLTLEAFTDRYTAIGKGYYTHVVKARLTQATTDDTLIELAVTTYSSWQNTIDALGMASAFATEKTEAQDLLGKGVVNAFNKSYAGCLAHDVGQVKRFAALGHFALSLGLTHPSEDEIQAKLENCLHFELDLELQLHRSREDATHHHDHVTMDTSSLAPIPFNADSGKPEGNLPWHVDEWEWDDPICFQAGGDATPIQDAHAQLSVDANLVVTHLPSGGTSYKGDPPKLKLTLLPGDINTRSQCAVNADPTHPATGNGGAAQGWFKQTLHHEWGTYQMAFLNPFSDWIYKGEEFPWATATETTLEEGLQSYDGQLLMILTHDPAP